MSLRFLVTAGPTREPIDAVRFLTNLSSGRMGTAIAEAAALAGHDVTLLLGAGPDAPEDRPGLTCHRFETTADLQTLLAETFPSCDVLIMAAAVSDFIPRCEDTTIKLDRAGGPLTLTFDPAPDLVAALAADARDDQTLIGFALEPQATLEARAREKLARKGLDAIVANGLDTMEATTVSATMIYRDGRREVLPPNQPKRACAAWLVDAAATLSGMRLTDAQG